MADHTLSRRNFLKGCCATAAVAGIAPAMFYAQPAIAGTPHDTLVHVFLRGGIDGLNLVVPIDGNDRGYYEDARPTLSIPATGAYAALPLTLQGGAGSGFGLHPSAGGLHALWQESRLAIVHACGMSTTITRSHFDAQLYCDLGTPGRQGSGTGWLARAWDSDPVGGGAIPLLGVGGSQPASLLGASDALSMASPTEFALNAGPWQWRESGGGRPAALVGVNDVLGSFVSGRTDVEHHARAGDAALRRIRELPFTGTLPTGWPTSTFARQLWTVAQAIRFGTGLRYATVDLGGWDTHEGQGTAGSGYHYYQNKIAELSEALTAFYIEIAAGGESSRVTVAVQSEFGRRVRQNGSGGTDHGYGNPLLVLGDTVNGRRFHGQWPGLDPAVLSPYFGDVPVTTDYRQVFSELLIRRMGNAHLGQVFPQYAGYAPLGIVQGQDLPPVHGVPRNPRTRPRVPAA